MMLIQVNRLQDRVVDCLRNPERSSRRYPDWRLGSSDFDAAAMGIRLESSSKEVALTSEACPANPLSRKIISRLTGIVGGPGESRTRNLNLEQQRPRFTLQLCRGGVK